LIQAEQEAAQRWQQARADLIGAVEIYQNARLTWKTWTLTGALRLNQRTDLLDQLWKAGELDTTDYLVQLKQALETAVEAIEHRGRLWRAWVAWLATSGQVDQWLFLTGDQQ
jgi:cobalt-zinc-cadmium efflux system outer membrane protein